MPDEPGGNVVPFKQRLIDAGLAPHLEPKALPALSDNHGQPAASTPTDNPGGRTAHEDPERAKRWLGRKFDADLEQLRTTPEGQRNQTINAIAYSLGRFIPTWLNENDIIRALYDAGLQAGLTSDELLGRDGRGGTIRSGIDAGKREPRDPPIRTDPAADRTSSTPPTATASTSTPTETPNVEASQAAETPSPPTVRELLPTLDWHALWADQDEEEWIIEPLLPARRLVALYSAPKVGKSLLLLELCVAMVTGRDVLGVTLDRPRNVLYVDFENDPKADVRSRLQAMGIGPDDLERLHYLSFPTLAALDSERGGLELMSAVSEYACEVVVVDTVSRAIAGEENENDTWLNFYRHTGLRMKQAGIALIRLDHSGKDETKGQRGGSAKSGDVDAVWRLSRVTDDTYRLDCEAARLPIVERTLVLHRQETPLRHRVDAEGRAGAWRTQVDACIRALDELGVPYQSTVRDSAEALRIGGGKAKNNVVSEAVKQRKKRSPLHGEQTLE